MLKRLKLSDFTAIKIADLEFSRGINVFLGANATGKTHVLKLLYSVVKVFEQKDRPTVKLPGTEDGSFPAILGTLLKNKLENVFRPDANRRPDHG